MSYYYHRFARFLNEPKKGETLREFVEREAYDRAKMCQNEIEEVPPEKRYLSGADYTLIQAMPVNLCVYVSNYSWKKEGFNAPPIVAERLGCKVATDDEYSFYGTLGDFLIHISATQYPFLAELEYPDWQLHAPDLISYAMYDYDYGGHDEDEEEEE